MTGEQVLSLARFAVSWHGIDTQAALVKAGDVVLFRSDLWHGACRGGGVIQADRGREAAYILRAPYSRWKEVVTGELDPIKAMMQGKLKVQGDLPTIVRQVRAANELVELTQQIATEFPDGA